MIVIASGIHETSTHIALVLLRVSTNSSTAISIAQAPVKAKIYGENACRSITAVRCSTMPVTVSAR